jgi:hypothetical protein
MFGLVGMARSVWIAEFTHKIAITEHDPEAGVSLPIELRFCSRFENAPVPIVAYV